MADANVLTYAQIFEQVLDEQMLEVMTSAWMEANASQVRYSGGNTVNIPKMSMEGLGNYSRSTGFDNGPVTLTWEPRTLTQDRGKEFNLDAQDVDETNFVLQAGMVMGEFQRTKVAPEVDAYRYSKIFSLANADLKTGAYSPVVGTVYTQLKTDISAIQDVIGETEELVIMISHSAANTLDLSTEFDKDVQIEDFMVGGVATKVKSFDGIPMIRIPSVRFKSAYTFSATDGFAAAATAMSLNWIIAARSALIAVVKTDKTRVFAPDVNQDMDAWKIQYRKYHDIWIKDNALAGVYVSYTPIAPGVLAPVFAQGSANGTTKATVTPGAGNTLAIKVQTGAFTVYYNDIPTGTTAYTSGADIAVTAGQHLGVYELDATGRVVKFVDHVVLAGEIK